MLVYPSLYSIMDNSIYVAILISFAFFILFYVFSYRKGLYIFEPITIVYVLYLLIFFVRPFKDLINQDMVTQEGTDISAGCIKGNILLILGLLSLLIGYYSNSKEKSIFRSSKYTKPISPSLYRSVYNIAIKIWCVSFILTMVYFLGSGFSFIYVISLGANGDATLSGDSALLIFSIFKSCLITSWLYIFIFGKNKLVKLLTFCLGLVVFIGMGGRSLTITYLAVPVVYYYISRMKRPKLSAILVMIVLGLFLCVVMQTSRTGIRTGEGLSIAKITSESVESVFYHELTTYKAYYAVVDALPERMGYCYGRGIFWYTLIMMIPRALWPGKPNPPIYEVIGVSMDEAAVQGGAVYPNIGEFYVEFGPVGVVVFMFLFGYLLKHVNILRRCCPAKSNGLILYSGIFSILLQVIIRGYTPSNFYQVLLVMAPALIISNYCKKRA